MRLPGTMNLASNELPTPHFMRQYKELRKKQAERKAAVEARLKAEKAEKEAAAWPHCKKCSKSGKASEGKASVGKGEGSKGGDGKGADGEGGAGDKGGDGKGGEEQGEKKDGSVKKDGPENKDGSEKKDGGEWTTAQDEALIRLKLEGKTWKDIAVEVGKDAGTCKGRFKTIKPGDFDAKMQEAGKAGKAGKAEEKGKGKEDEKEDQKDEDKEKGKEPGEEEDGKESWLQPDTNWTEAELDTLFEIAQEELKEAFARMAMKLADNTGKKVHPRSLAEKVMGRKPEWV